MNGNTIYELVNGVPIYRWNRFANELIADCSVEKVVAFDYALYVAANQFT